MGFTAWHRVVFPALVGDTNLPLLLEALGSVDAELARIHYALRDLAAWPASDSPDLARARVAIQRGFAGVRSMRALLVQRGDDYYESRASSLRARAIVVLLQLVELRGHDVGDVLGRSFASLEAFIAHVLAEVGRANTRWIGHSGDASALLRAEQAFAEIGHDPSVASVLARAALSKNPQVRLTCATLGALLGSTVELTVSSMSSSSPSREVG